MQVYLFVVAAVIIFGQIMPQRGKKRKRYIFLMAVLHSFVCGFRYMYLTGDLRKYASLYYEMVDYGWFSDYVVQGGRNTGFFWMQKLFSQLSGGNFQVFLFVLALITEIAVVYIIYKYSPIPWVSYLVWNCLGFYVFGFSSIKQAMAMAVLLFAFDAIIKEKPLRYLIIVFLATMIHMPAIVFLPAYWLTKSRISLPTITGYVAAGIIVYVFRGQIVNFITNIYYEDETFVLQEAGLGGRFFMILAILLAGVLIKGFKEKNFQKLFNLMVVAVIFQILSGYDNVFTRMTDYYFMFSILYIPMLFTKYSLNTELNKDYVSVMFPFNERSLRLLLWLIVIILIFFYYNYNIGVEIAYEADDYTNFRFMWDVIQ